MTPAKEQLAEAIQAAYVAGDPDNLEGAILMRWIVVGELVIPRSAAVAELIGEKAISVLSADNLGRRLAAWEARMLYTEGFLSTFGHATRPHRPDDLPPGI